MESFLDPLKVQPLKKFSISSVCEDQGRPRTLTINSLLSSSFSVDESDLTLFNGTSAFVAVLFSTMN